MILRRVELGRFGKWTDRTFEFRRGANLVVGGNEAGKTTLAAAIPAVIFGVRDKERFIPWAGAGGGCDAALVWEDQQYYWRLERNLCTDEVSLGLWHEGGDVLKHFSGHAEAGEPRGEYAELLRQLCGLGENEPLNSAMFGSSDPDAPFPPSQTALIGQSTLQRDLSEIGLASEAELQMVRRQLAHLEKRWYELRPAAGELKEVVQQLEGVQQELATAGALPQPEPPEADAPVLPPRGSCPAPTQQWMTEKLQSRQHLQEELARLGLPANLPPDFPLLLAEAEALRRELVALQKESVRIREARAVRPAPPWKVAAAVSILLLLFGIAGSLWLGWAAAGSLGGALLATLVWLGNSHFHGRHLAESARLKGQAQAIEERRETAQELLSALDDRFKGLGISPSAVSLLKMQKSIERGRLIADELGRLEGALSVLEGMTDAMRQQESAATPSAEADMTPLPLVPAWSEAVQVLQERHRYLLQEQERLQELLRERQQIEEEGDRLRDREATLAHQLRTNANSPMTAADDGGGAGRQFADECARLLALLGGRRSWQVAVTGHGSLLLKEGEGNWRSPFAFGHGTCDLLGLAARLASGQLPLLFDEALVHLDRTRQAEVFGALERIAAQRQVIVFCREEQLPKRLARERWQVLSLEEEPISRERDEHAGQLHLL
jgi:hypothetical protein